MSNQKNGVIYEMENSTGGAGAGSGVGKYREVGSELHLPFRHSHKQVERLICS